MRNPIAGLESFAVAARRVGRNPSRLRQLRIAGLLPQAIKVGRDWYLPKGCKIPVDNGLRKR